MPTIKTTGTGEGLRILTKTAGGVKRVSCSCCECCMYPAQDFFDGLYTENDLPDSLMLNPYDLNGSISVEIQRNGLIYGPHEFGAEYSQQIRLVSNTFLNEGPRWVLEQVGVDAELEGFLDDNPCLFKEGNLTGEYGGGAGGITDLFEDTFTVSGPISGTVTRQSLCVWTGTGLTLSNFGYQWKLNGRDKSGNQNSPVGSYPDSFSVSA